MNGKIYNCKNRTKVVLVYLVAYIAYLTVGRIVPLVHAMTDPVDALLSYGFAGLGILLLLQDLITDRYLFRTRFWYALLLFVGVLGVSTLTNAQYGLGDNIKTTLWACIHLLLVYTLAARLDSRQCQGLIRKILWCLGLVWTVCVLISLVQYTFQVGYWEQMHKGVFKRQGFVENRLFGLFSDPNAAAMISIWTIFFIAYCLETDKTVWKRWVGGVAIVLHYFYVILSGSRTAAICLVVAMMVKAALAAWNFTCRKQYRWGKTAVVVLAGVLVVSFAVNGVNHLTKAGLSEVPGILDRAGVEMGHVPGIGGLQDEPDTDKPSEEEDPLDIENLLDREDVREENMLNNRQYIWTGYLDSLQGAKWIFGLSPRNAVAYIQDHYPDNYIAQTGYIAHSDYIAVIAYTGLAGVAALLLFGGLAVLWVFRKLRAEKHCSSFYMMAIVILCSMGVYAVSYMDILFCNTITGVLFWLMASVVLHDTNQEQAARQERELTK